MSDQTAKLEWRDDKIPVSTHFDDPYFSLDNGLSETQHVFLAGNDLPARFAPGFHIAELGFGTGLNFLAVWKAWEEAGHDTPLRFTSFEAFPMNAEEMARALAAFPEVAAYAERLCVAWAEDPTLSTLQGIDACVVIGDARETLAEQNWQADAWFLDGFSPAKNPELWDEALMKQVGLHTKDDGTAATYTAAGFVRRGLEAAGFEVERVPGFGRKRHMTVARKASS
ncbi:tRNA (5-methylaminomethyl-2-thiouridine)(34)-methyltransferase MnmD [Cognatishimia activa]|uniref:tRNA 5-methylaminomethyl-2-thiouridine biosynthesis bifunctional protein MnmC n=1 Tax=Cognatishimia activa TaxID=1715691 RepID=A0A0P1IL66_9RHOB|nr:tRNA (5-methylaminomethyl-2-thiouridine)(34)-methyltransferase MnmD [Cognatishimia activa]CUI54413.1 tRNA 5-methylaminomethyl-2-thiouridine biosynthesis bifunctional protein MnmC [Cognatishimia activa]CUK24332.1 tRNA 5-methylaminomethyl-2-thiouridine biosynthesis bifunctional protein MnmC [Cognatishimia activa]